MASSEERVVAVIMVGGPTKGTRFRPLSLNVPKPLFPLAGQPMVHHPITACKIIPNLVQIFLIGFYEEREFALYVSSISNELRIPVRYLREDKPHGSAGGLYSFRDYIMEENPSHIVLLNCDVCCSFPLAAMLEAHKTYGGMGTMLVIKVSAESASQFGELVADPDTKELLHYTEKPETFVSDLINCGGYIFTPEIFTAIEDVLKERKERANLRRVSSFEALHSATKSLPADFARLDQDILSPLAGKKQLYTYETLDFWEQIKTPGCHMCESNLETVYHLATECDCVRRHWSLLPAATNMEAELPSSLALMEEKLLEGKLKQHIKLISAIFSFVMWRERCRRAFSEERRQKGLIIEEIMEELPLAKLMAERERVRGSRTVQNSTADSSVN